jgi:hypothetical protein
MTLLTSVWHEEAAGAFRRLLQLDQRRSLTTSCRDHPASSGKACEMSIAGW